LPVRYGAIEVEVGYRIDMLVAECMGGPPVARSRLDMRIAVKAAGPGAQQKIWRKTLSPIWTQYSDQILAPNSAAAFMKSENARI
jgi:hypothetical protein